MKLRGASHWSEGNLNSPPRGTPKKAERPALNALVSILKVCFIFLLVIFATMEAPSIRQKGGARRSNNHTQKMIFCYLCDGQDITQNLKQEANHTGVKGTSTHLPAAPQRRPRARRSCPSASPCAPAPATAAAAATARAC
jgi:hypothetical protein